MKHDPNFHLAIGKASHGLLHAWSGIPEPWSLEPHPGFINDAVVDGYYTPYLYHTNTIAYIKEMEDEFLTRLVSDMC